MTEFEMRCTAKYFSMRFEDWLAESVSEQCMMVAMRRIELSMEALASLDAAQKAKEKKK